jgi:KUP system potassium uptake protein
VLGFRSSTGLAAAYGVAVTATMLITTLLFYQLLIHAWDWNPLKAGLVCGFFGTLELAFFAANVLKIPHGGWFPLVIGYGIFTLMTTWKGGRELLGGILGKRAVPLQGLLTQLDEQLVHRVPRTAVFMYGSRTGTPPAMLANLRHNGVLHATVVVLAVEITDRPYLFQSQRVRAFDLGHGVYRVVIKFGYLDRYDVPAALRGLKLNGSVFDQANATFFLGKETVIPRCLRESHMSYWRERLFAFMVRNARDATSFFYIPPDQVVEFGTQLEI